MKILLTNHHFQYYGGSETAVLSLYDSLVSKGHQVEVWSIVESTGGIRDKVNFKETIDWERDHYDLALVNHNSCLKEILSKPKRLADKIIFTSHGPLGGLEAPIQGADLYCAVSEEVARAYPEYDMKIIRNGVNLNRFNQTIEPSKTLSRVLLLSNRTTKDGINKIKEACDKFGIEFHHAGLNGQFTPKIEDEIYNSDLVITVGRGVLESMAMGKQVLIWDDRPYNGKGMGDGLVTDHIYLKSRQFNFSGRANKLDYTTDDLLNIFKNYTPVSKRPIIEKYHNIDNIAQEYLALSNTLNVKKDQSKKKILILAGLTYFHRSYSLSGMIKTQAKMFAEQGHEVGVIVDVRMTGTEAFNDTGAKIYKLLSKPEDTLDKIKDVVSQYDVVFTHDFVWLEAMKWLNNIVSQLEDLYPATLFIHQIHSSPGNESCPDWKKGRVKDNVFYSHPGKQLGGIVARHLELPANKVIQLEYTQDFIDEDGGDENLYHELDIVDQDFVGFYPAHPMPGKNIPAILHIVKALKDLNQRVKYIFTVNGVPGGRTRVDDYKDLAKKLDIQDNVVWMMDIPRYRNVVEYSDVKKIWKRTNLFIHPSLSEANPSILLEAMNQSCILLLNEDFDRFKEMAGAKSNSAIYHPFGSHLKNNQIVNQEGEQAKRAAEWIVKSSKQSFGFEAKNTVIQNYNRRKLYKDYMNFIDNTQAVDTTKKKVSVIIPVLNVTPLENVTPELIQFTKDCIKSIGQDAEIIVINNNPDDKNVYSDIQINNPYNYGVSRAWNQGIVRSSGEYIMILNSDVVLPINWQEEMLKYADKGLVFPWYVDNVYGEGEIPQDKATFPQIQGSCFMAHKSIFRKIGPFDQERYFAYAEDQDYWMRAKENGVKFYRANCGIKHKMNATSSKITHKTIHNDELIRVYGKENIFNKIFTASNQAFENWWGEKVKGV